MKLDGRLIRWISALAVLLAGGCFETSTPTIDAQEKSYLGETLEYRFSLPKSELKADDSRGEFWIGADAVVLSLEHKGDSIYSAWFTPEVDGALVPGPKDGSGFYRDLSFPTALKVLEDSGEFKVILADLDTTFDGPNFTTFAILSTPTASFMGYLPCERTSEITLAIDWHKIRCQERNDNSGLTPYSIVDFHSDLAAGMTKLELFKDLASRRLLMFAIDCEVFPSFRENIYGFETQCLAWDLR